MDIIKTKIKDLLVVKQKNILDKRGSLKVIFNDKFSKIKFKYEYYSLSKKNVVRGFHFQTKNQQIKYISVLKGKILDCVVDLRKIRKLLEKFLK